MPPEPAIANYDDHTAEEITQRLRKLSQRDLTKLEAYEKQGQGRTTVLEAITALRGDEPWSGYDEMEVEQVNDALKQRDGRTAGRVFDYERRHKGRTTVIDFAKGRRDESKSSSANSRGGSPSKSASKSTGGRSPKAVASPTKAKTASRPGTKPASRSTGARSRKAAERPTKAKTASRPAPRSSRSQQAKGSQGVRRPRSQSSGASRSRTQAPRRSTESSQPGSLVKEALQAASAKLRPRAKEALHSAEGHTRKLAKDTEQAVGSAAQAASAKLKPRATEALGSAEGRTRKLAKDTEQAVGSAAQGSRSAVATAVKDTGQAVAAAADKAKGPALLGGAALAALGGGIALGRRSNVTLRKRRRVLGVRVPRRKAVGKAARRAARAVDSVGATGQQIGQWSDDIKYLRRRVAGNDGFSAKPAHSRFAAAETRER